MQKEEFSNRPWLRWQLTTGPDFELLESLSPSEGFPQQPLHLRSGPKVGLAGTCGSSPQARVVCSHQAKYLPSLGPHQVLNHDKHVPVYATPGKPLTEGGGDHGTSDCHAAMMSFLEGLLYVPQGITQQQGQLTADSPDGTCCWLKMSNSFKSLVEHDFFSSSLMFQISSFWA